MILRRIIKPTQRIMYIIPKSLIADIQYNQRLIEQFKQGEISGAQLKSNRVPMGIYEQRQDGHFMLRIRCTGGLITPRQLRRVAEVARRVDSRCEYRPGHACTSVASGGRVGYTRRRW